MILEASGNEQGEKIQANSNLIDSELPSREGWKMVRVV